jgi:hypothetical protein
MKAEFYRQVLSDNTITHGLVKMPKNFEIDKRSIKENIVFTNLISKEKAKINSYYLPYPRYAVGHNRAIDMLNRFVVEHLNMYFKLTLRPVDTWGNVYFPNDYHNEIRHIDPLNLRETPDFVMLYGVDIKDRQSKITFKYDDNRRVSREYWLPLKTNQFILFPSTTSYSISKNKSDDINTVLTITYADESK